MEKYIDAAVEQFRTLLNEQIARERKMEQDKRLYFSILRSRAIC